MKKSLSALGAIVLGLSLIPTIGSAFGQDQHIVINDDGTTFDTAIKSEKKIVKKNLKGDFDTKKVVDEIKKTKKSPEYQTALAKLKASVSGCPTSANFASAKMNADFALDIIPLADGANSYSMSIDFPIIARNGSIIDEHCKTGLFVPDGDILKKKFKDQIIQSIGQYADANVQACTSAQKAEAVQKPIAPVNNSAQATSSGAVSGAPK
jgi:hypothetical protein